MLRLQRFLPLAILMISALPFGSTSWAQHPVKGASKTQKEWEAGFTTLQNQRYAEALPHLDKVVLALGNPAVPVSDHIYEAVYECRADAHYGLEHWKLAVDDYNKAIQINPSNARAYAYRGIARKATGDYDGLIADEEKAVSLDAQYEDWLEGARSTVLWRRCLLGFGVLGGIIVVLGAIPLGKSLVALGKAEKAARG